MAQCAQQGTYQCRLARTKVADKVNDHARPQADSQPTAKQRRRSLIRQKTARLFTHARLLAMQGNDSIDPIDPTPDWRGLTEKIRVWGQELGFAEVGFARPDTTEATPGLMRWLALGRHGEMDYMAKHAPLRADPAALQPGTMSIISARLPYWPQATEAEAVLADGTLAYVSRYALGRDYHKTIRNRLQKLADRMQQEIGAFSYRAFSDSAPVMEVEFARQAGTAWRGKHTLSLTRGGSWHFLGELYTSLPLPPDAPIDAHCGTCTACIDACPTQAIVAPYEVDARRCISYLTIELDGAIPEELRPLMGNRIYGCDDCQLCCPWNREATTGDPDFSPRHNLEASTLATLFAWTETEFDQRLQGSPIRRIGHERWLRNIAVALGNAASTPEVLAALASRSDHPSPMVQEHVAWALGQHPK
ncbi:MAG: epoxyqueuosine reductase [Pseudomonadota bacterium]|nr:epoxyqueuosine reductase [Pseudomonadota bacterium]